MEIFFTCLAMWLLFTGGFGHGLATFAWCAIACLVFAVLATAYPVTWAIVAVLWLLAFLLSLYGYHHRKNNTKPPQQSNKASKASQPHQDVLTFDVTISPEAQRDIKEFFNNH